MQKREQQWTGVTQGGTLGQGVLLKLFARVNPSALYWLLALIVPFYMLFSRKAYLAISEYFRSQWGYGVWKACCKTYRNFVLFGQCMFDKFAVYAGKKDFFDVGFSGLDDAQQCVNNPKGLIVATSHVGNFELTGFLFQMNVSIDKNPFLLFQQQNRNFHIMVHGEETETIRSGRKQRLAQNDILVTQANDGMTHLFALREALQKGDVVNITCDRFTSSNRGTTCRFLNGIADFPTSAFALAVHCDVPVLSVFCMKEGKKHYHVHYKLLDADADADTKQDTQEKIHRYAQSYADAIGTVLKQYPEQWFNFYEFWK
jgi:predicted LPLAT superfamily acyltransferase